MPTKPSATTQIEIMNQNSISRYETGEREADYTTLILLANYFDVSIDYLLERTDNPKINFYRAPCDRRSFYIQNQTLYIQKSLYFCSR